MSAYVALTVLLTAITGTVIYIKGIIKQNVTAMKSTWIILALATGLNASSFLVNRPDLVNGLYGIADFLICLSIMIAVLVYSKKFKVKFSGFEKYYLAGAAVCASFWIASKNPFWTNLLAQTLIISAYIPTLHNTLLNKESTESKTVWTIWSIAAFLSLYPAIMKENLLAIIYSSRGMTMCLLILFLTYKFQKKPVDI